MFKIMVLRAVNFFPDERGGDLIKHRLPFRRVRVRPLTAAVPIADTIWTCW